MMIKFFWNGMKTDGDGDTKLQRCWYSFGNLAAPHHPETISIYARDSRFRGEVRDAFSVENASDSMTDYFETDHIRVAPDHPLYARVKHALDAMTAHSEAIRVKRNAGRTYDRR